MRLLQQAYVAIVPQEAPASDQKVSPNTGATRRENGNVGLREWPPVVESEVSSTDFFSIFLMTFDLRILCSL